MDVGYVTKRRSRECTQYYPTKSVESGKIPTLTLDE
jgi:hypothetical protein